VASFRSTLEETVAAKLIIIILDISDPHAGMQLQTVNATLTEIGATQQPRLLALNKIDQLPDQRELAVWLNRHPEAFPISAVSGEGLEELRAAAMAHFLGGLKEVQIALPMGDTRRIMFLEKRAQVLDRQYRDTTAVFTVRIGRRQIDQLLALGAAQLTIDGMKPHEALAKHWENGKAAPLVRIPPHETHVG